MKPHQMRLKDSGEPWYRVLIHLIEFYNCILSIIPNNDTVHAVATTSWLSQAMSMYVLA
jgi:hypothetical protein